MTVNDELAMLLGDAAPPAADTHLSDQSSPYHDFDAIAPDPMMLGLGGMHEGGLGFDANGMTQTRAPLEADTDFGFDFNSMASTGMSMWNAPMGME